MPSGPGPTPLLRRAADRLSERFGLLLPDLFFFPSCLGMASLAETGRPRLVRARDSVKDSCSFSSLPLFVLCPQRPRSETAGLP